MDAHHNNYYFMQLPSGLHGSNSIISALDNGTRNMANLIHIIKEIAILWKPASMDEIVARGEGEREREKEREITSSNSITTILSREEEGQNPPWDKFVPPMLFYPYYGVAPPPPPFDTRQIPPLEQNPEMYTVPLHHKEKRQESSSPN